MRVITGKARGIQLKTPDGMQTRPTTDRVKEALFSIIHFDIPGAKVLDLFGGTGQLSERRDAGAFGQCSRQSVAILPDGLQHGGIQGGHLVFRKIRIYRIIALIQKIQIIQLRRRIGYIDGQLVLRTHIGLHRCTEQRAQKKQDT